MSSNTDLHLKSVIVERSPDRRNGAPEAPVFGPLLVEAEWEPAGTRSPQADNWLRAAGAVPERRTRERRSSRG